MSCKFLYRDHPVTQHSSVFSLHSILLCPGNILVLVKWDSTPYNSQSFSKAVDLLACFIDFINFHLKLCRSWEILEDNRISSEYTPKLVPDQPWFKPQLVNS